MTDRPHLGAGDIPTAIFPTDNEWGVPLLDLAQQASVLEAPFTRWGREKRKSRMRGTWHFYTEDRKFAPLWARPYVMLNSGAVATVEPNFSVHEQTPRAVALYRTFQKRYLARLWQEHGLRVMVDLNVSPVHADLNLLGVPRGWRSYATRGATDRMAETEREYRLACDRAGTERIVFVVYGGGRRVCEAARSNAWLWFPEEADLVGGRAWAKEAEAAQDHSPFGAG